MNCIPTMEEEKRKQDRLSLSKCISKGLMHVGAWYRETPG